MKTIDGTGREAVRDYADRRIHLDEEKESPIKVWGLLIFFVIIFPLLLLFGPNGWGAEVSLVPFEDGKSYQIAQGRVIELHLFDGCNFSVFLYAVDDGQVKENLADFSADLTPSKEVLIGVTGENGHSKIVLVTCRDGALAINLPPGAEEYHYKED